jgi:hypothetical protein
MANPSREHWNVVQWILRYLCGSSNACLCFGKSGDGLFGYVDSVDTWLILVESIGMLFSGFSDICVVLLMLVYALLNMEMVCFVMLIQWIHSLPCMRTPSLSFDDASDVRSTGISMQGTRCL